MSIRGLFADDRMAPGADGRLQVFVPGMTASGNGRTSTWETVGVPPGAGPRLADWLSHGKPTGFDVFGLFQ